MDRYCPECNSTMTPSLVGYLCVNCGHLQRFYSANEAGLATPIATKAAPITGSAENPNKPHKSEVKKQNKIKSTLSRLMVPEIAPPHHHLIGDGGDNIQPVLADKIENEATMPALVITENNNEESSPLKTNNGTSTEIISESKDESQDFKDKQVPNQSSNLNELQSALHPQRNTSIWVMLGLALLMLIVSAAVLFLIILN